MGEALKMVSLYCDTLGPALPPTTLLWFWFPEQGSELGWFLFILTLCQALDYMLSDLPHLILMTFPLR